MDNDQSNDTQHAEPPNISSTSLQSSSSSSGSTTASTSTCKFQSSPPPKTSADGTSQHSNNRDSMQFFDLKHNSSLQCADTNVETEKVKRIPSALHSSSTATSSASNSKSQKFTTFCTPEVQIVNSPPPPKEFGGISSKVKVPLPSALSTSSSSSGIAGSTISPVSLVLA